MALVKLFGSLRQLAGESTLTVEGKDVEEIFVALRQRHKALVEAIMNGAELRPYYKIMVNGYDIALSGGFATPVRAEDVIAIFPPISGGDITHVERV